MLRSDNELLIHSRRCEFLDVHLALRNSCQMEYMNLSEFFFTLKNEASSINNTEDDSLRCFKYTSWPFFRTFEMSNCKVNCERVIAIF